MPESDLLYHELTRTIIGAFFAAHRELGSGFLEAVYKNGLAVLLRRAGLRVEREAPFEIIFHGESIGTYRADFVVERKGRRGSENGSSHRPVHIAQVRNYLRVSKLKVGLLSTSGRRRIFKRLVATADGKVSVTA